MPQRRIIVSRDARNDFREIWAYLSSQAGRRTQLLADIYDAIQRLAGEPALGHIRPDIRRPDYRAWTVKRYVIVYAATPSELRIARVVHGARDFRELFP